MAKRQERDEAASRLTTVETCEILGDAPTITTIRSRFYGIAGLHACEGTEVRQHPGFGYEKGREGSIAVIACHHSVVGPRDPQSGLPTGQRMHKPFTIVKVTDKATPVLYRVLHQ